MSPFRIFVEELGFQLIQEIRIMYPQQKFLTIIDIVESIYLDLRCQLANQPK